MDRYAIILAAGKGTRMKSLIGDHSKISFPIMGKPVLEYVLDAIEPLEFKKTIVVAGFGGEITKRIVGNRAITIQETNIVETASSVNMARPELENNLGYTLVIYGDLPLITYESLRRLFKKHEKDNNDLTFMTSVVSKHEGYARVIREHKSNAVLAVKEENKCSEYELDISEVNPGVYVFKNDVLFKYLKKDVYTISEIVEKIVKDKLRVGTYVLEDAVEVYSINDRVQLAYADKVIRKRVNDKLMLSGVSIEDPETAYISPDIKIGQDTVIMPNTTIMGKTTIGKNNLIGPNAYINGVVIGNDNILSYSWISNSEIGNKNKIESFSKISNSKIGNNCIIKSFVELESARIEDNSKVNR